MPLIMFIRPSNLSEAGAFLSCVTEVTRDFNISGKIRAPNDLPPNALDIYLANVLTDLFRFEIAHYFGKNNGEQIRNLVINIEREMRKNPEFKSDIVALANIIAGTPMTAQFDERLSHSNGLRIETIQRTVCRFYDISMCDMKDPKRYKEIVLPRHIAMFLCRELTFSSWPGIAREFKRKNHTTIMHAVEKIIGLMKNDAHFREDVCKLRCALLG